MIMFFYSAGTFSDISLSCLSLFSLLVELLIDTCWDITDRCWDVYPILISSVLSAALYVFSSNLFFITWLPLKSWLCLICCLTCPLSFQISVTVLFIYGSSMCLFFHSVLSLCFQFLLLCQQSLNTCL